MPAAPARPMSPESRPEMVLLLRPPTELPLHLLPPHPLPPQLLLHQKLLLRAPPTCSTRAPVTTLPPRLKPPPRPLSPHYKITHVALASPPPPPPSAWL